MRLKLSKTNPVFLQACCAFTFVTLPSLSDPVLRLELTVESCAVALSCRCFSQAEAMIKAAEELTTKEVKEEMDKVNVSLFFYTEMYPLMVSDSSPSLTYRDQTTAKQYVTNGTAKMNRLSLSMKIKSKSHQRKRS